VTQPPKNNFTPQAFTTALAMLLIAAMALLFEWKPVAAVCLVSTVPICVLGVVVQLQYEKDFREWLTQARRPSPPPQETPGGAE